jgi:hypothetical protein
MGHIKDFKSIVYKMNGFSLQSVKALEVLLLRKFPYNLEELRLIDLKISANVTSALVDALVPKNYLSKLSLINIKLTRLNFEKIV